MLERIGNRDFRLAVFKWAEDLKKAGRIPVEVAVRRSFFDDGHGEKFVTIVGWISVLALQAQLEHEQRLPRQSDKGLGGSDPNLPGTRLTPDQKVELQASLAAGRAEIAAMYMRNLHAQTMVAITARLQQQPSGVSKDPAAPTLDEAAQSLLAKMDAKLEEPFADSRGELLNELAAQMQRKTELLKGNEGLCRVLAERSAQLFVKAPLEVAPEPDELDGKLLERLLSPGLFSRPACRAKQSRPVFLDDDPVSDFLVH